MSKIIIHPQQAGQFIAALLSLDVSALQTTDIAQCREPIWELRQSQNQTQKRSSVFNSVNRQKGQQSSLCHCIERLFNCLSEEAQQAISQGIDKRVRSGIEYLY